SVFSFTVLLLVYCFVLFFFFFFFQAEDGIRDKLVTGVQTCALPICSRRATPPIGSSVTSGVETPNARAVKMWPNSCATTHANSNSMKASPCQAAAGPPVAQLRSEERRVGKECTTRGAQYHQKEKAKR